jgi:hypothetical protein
VTSDGKRPSHEAQRRERADKARVFPLPQGGEGRDEATIDGVAKSLACFEDATGRKEFRRFHREQAVAFKRRLSDAANARTGERVSKATVLSTLRDLRNFFFWLAHLPGFKSHITYADADYFNLSDKDVAVARARRDKPIPTLAQIEHAPSGMPAETIVQRRDQTKLSVAPAAATDEALWAVYAAAVERSKETLRFEDGLLAGHAYAGFVKSFVTPSMRGRS